MLGEVVDIRRVVQLGQKYLKGVRDTKMDEGTSGGSEKEDEAVEDD